MLKLLLQQAQNPSLHSQNPFDSVVNIVYKIPRVVKSPPEARFAARGYGPGAAAADSPVVAGLGSAGRCPPGYCFRGWHGLPRSPTSGPGRPLCPASHLSAKDTRSLSQPGRLGRTTPAHPALNPADAPRCPRVPRPAGLGRGGPGAGQPRRSAPPPTPQRGAPGRAEGGGSRWRRRRGGSGSAGE